MKIKKLAYIAGLGLLGAIIATSCGSPKNDSVGFENFGYQDTLVVVADDTAGNSMDFNFLFPVSYSDTAVLAKLQTDFIQNSLGLLYAAKPAEALSLFVDGIKARMLQQSAEGWSIEGHNEILFQQKGLLQYCVVFSEYSGGAHGLDNRVYRLFDLTTGKPVFCSDIFADTDTAAIRGLLTGALQQFAAANDDVKTWTTDIYPTNNLYFGDNAIAFYYNPYVVAPFSAGAVELKIPYTEIGKYIKKDSPVQRLLKK